MENSLARSQVEVGSVIDETYIIEAMIGRGGMGAVYLASHRRLAGQAGRDQDAARATLARRRDPRAVPARGRDRVASSTTRTSSSVLDYNALADGTPYIVLEYLEGETLAQRLADGARCRSSGARRSCARSARRCRRRTRAGSCIAISSRENIFLRADRGRRRASRGREGARLRHLEDARAPQTRARRRTATLLGTPQYMAPEQATGKHADVDARTDIFALGAIVYEMLSGQPAFTGESVRRGRVQGRVRAAAGRSRKSRRTSRTCSCSRSTRRWRRRPRIATPRSASLSRR